MQAEGALAVVPGPCPVKVGAAVGGVFSWGLGAWVGAAGGGPPPIPVGLPLCTWCPVGFVLGSDAVDEVALLQRDGVAAHFISVTRLVQLRRGSPLYTDLCYAVSRHATKVLLYLPFAPDPIAYVVVPKGEFQQ